MNWYDPASVSKALEFYFISTLQTTIPDDEDKIIPEYEFRDTIILDYGDRGNLQNGAGLLLIDKAYFTRKIHCI
jgi:hypothetical protein